MTTPPSPLSPFNAQGNVLLQKLYEFLRLETAGGFVLVLAAILALILANSPLSNLYHFILNDVAFTIGFEPHDAGSGRNLALSKSILHWINDGMMVIFFFLVGLEIKREFKEGQLASRDRALLPLLGALGGMIVPAVIFLFITRAHPELQHGWAIPSATDIAFTLGVIALLGTRVPLPLKILVMAIAVIDDLGAIIIIALFYAQNLFLPALAAAAAALMLLLWMNRYGVVRPAAYVLVGTILWLAILKSGAHATLAGVITALSIPMHDTRDPTDRPVDRLVHALHPWVAFLILPVFAFANAGVPLAGISPARLADPVVLGITLGLFIGKQVGIFGMILLAVYFRISPKPVGATWVQIYGVAILCGIGFTMSLFIGTLAYTNPAMQVDVRLGVILGSLLSALTGYILLRRGLP